MSKKKTISHLDEQTLNNIKKDLLRRQKQLEDEIGQITGKNTDNQNDEVIFPDFGDKKDEQVFEVATFSQNLSLEKTLKNILKDVEGALARIKKGTYGICHYCHLPIKKERLKIRPASGACVECKKKLKEKNDQ